MYYLCLSLGFTGRYCHEGDEYLLEQLQTSNLKLLTGSSIGIPSLEREDLFPDAYPVDIDHTAQRESMPRLSVLTMICFAGPVVLFAGLYLIYYFVLSSLGQNILSTV